MQELQKTPMITENSTLDNKIQYAKPQKQVASSETKADKSTVDIIIYYWLQTVIIRSIWRTFSIHTHMQHQCVSLKTHNRLVKKFCYTANNNRYKWKSRHNNACSLLKLAVNNCYALFTQSTALHKNQPSKLGFSVIPFTCISCNTHSTLNSLRI